MDRDTWEMALLVVVVYGALIALLCVLRKFCGCI